MTGNDIHDNNNIGIDAIGYERTLPEPYRYTDLNRARNGVIADNTVRNIDLEGQPDLLRGRRVVQLRRRHLRRRRHAIRIERNRALGQRHRRRGRRGERPGERGPRARLAQRDHAQRVRRHRHRRLLQRQRGLRRREDRPARTTTASCTTRCTRTTSSTTGRRRSWSSTTPTAPRSRTTGSGRRTTTARSSGTVDGAEADGLSTPLRADHNTYWTTGGRAKQATFGSLGTTYTGFDAYRKATGQDRHSRFAKFRGRAEACARSSVQRSLSLVEGPGPGRRSREPVESGLCDEAVRGPVVGCRGAGSGR